MGQYASLVFSNNEPRQPFIPTDLTNLTTEELKERFVVLEKDNNKLENAYRNIIEMCSLCDALNHFIISMSELPHNSNVSEEHATIARNIFNEKCEKLFVDKSDIEIEEIVGGIIKEYNHFRVLGKLIEHPKPDNFSIEDLKAHYTETNNKDVKHLVEFFSYVLDAERDVFVDYFKRVNKIVEK